MGADEEEMKKRWRGKKNLEEILKIEQSYMSGALHEIVASILV